MPNDWEPMTKPRPLSCNAPATISDADADPWLIRTTTGFPFAKSPGLAKVRSISVLFLPRVDTISPESRNASDTSIAAVRYPPGLLRTSKTYPITSFFSSAFNASRNSLAVVAPKSEIRMYPIFLSSPFSSNLTDFTLIIARFNVMVRGSWPSEMMVNLTLVPGRPFIFLTAWFNVKSNTWSSSMCVM